jgi:hypothetical protein
MQLKAGTRLQSTTCDTQVVVVKAPKDDVDVRCGGQPMVPVDEDAPRTEPSAAHAGGTQLGKRYASDDAGIELLCSKAGEGSLSIGDEPVQLKDAKALPSSD